MLRGSLKSFAQTIRANIRSSGWVSIVSAICVMTAGSFVLLGWSKGIESLKRIELNLVAMNPVTACCLILIGAAIALHRFRFTRSAVALGALVAGVGLAKVLDLAWEVTPVDRLLFPDLLDTEPGSHPNRMAPNTATAIVLLGLSLVFVASKLHRTQMFAQTSGIAVMLISMFAVVGYAFGIDQMSTVGPFIPMALHTGLSLLIAATGVITLNRDFGLLLVLRDPGPAGSMTRKVLPLAVLIPVATGAAHLWGERLGYYGMEAGAALMVMANVLVTCALLVPSILALYRSDCIRRDRERALGQSEHYNRTINEASPDCVSLLDLNGNVLFSNDAALSAYGLETERELIGRPWGHRLDGGTRAQKNAALAIAREGGVGRLRLSLPDHDGVLRWFESLVSKLSDADGQLVRFIVMSRDITQQKHVEDQVRWEATHDSLTELPNRALFQAQLDRMWQRSNQPHFALLLLDLDDFKLVNDTLGHDAGDSLLRTVAQRLRHAVGQDDFVARLGGDEFAIILDGVRSEAAATIAAAKIVEVVKRPWLYNGRVSECRVSIGASLTPQYGEGLSELLRNADMALYAAKSQHRGQTAVFHPTMRAEMQKRSSELSLARHALRDDLIRPMYQPKVDLISGRLIGFEALLRWQHPTRGIQPPASFGAAFEDFELARELTDHMLTCILADMRRWLDAGVDFGHIAVNVTAADFKQEPFAKRLLERLDASAVPISRLQIEVTETVFLGRGAECVERALKTLSASGMRIALDDFGTGYASLSHLKKFPINAVKIDRSFLRDLKEDAHNAAIITAVVSLGTDLDLDVVAEGVETREQEAYLISSGCRFGQGYLYGKATAASRVPGLIASWPGKVRHAA